MGQVPWLRMPTVSQVLCLPAQWLMVCRHRPYPAACGLKIAPPLQYQAWAKTHVGWLLLFTVISHRFFPVPSTCIPLIRANICQEGGKSLFLSMKICALSSKISPKLLVSSSFFKRWFFKKNQSQSPTVSHPYSHLSCDSDTFRHGRAVTSEGDLAGLSFFPFVPGHVCSELPRQAGAQHYTWPGLDAAY